METTNDNTVLPQSARVMTLLELNDIRLDMTHTVLTPDYLEKIKAEQATPPSAQPG